MMTLRFLGALLRANKAEQDEFHARQIPKGVFPTRQAEIQWVYDYRKRFNRYPTPAAFRSRFSSVELPKVKDSVATAIKSILDKDTLARVAKMVENAQELLDGGGDPVDIVSSFRNSIQNFQQYDVQYTDVRAGGLESYRRYKKRLVESYSNHSSFQPSPWDPLNKLLKYCDWGEHTVVASRTSIGKTYLMVNWAYDLAMKGETVLFVSKEMPTHQILDRLQMIAYQLPADQFRGAELPAKVVRRWKQELKDKEKSAKLANFVATGHEVVGGVGFSHILGKIQQYRPSVLFVDGAYLIDPEGLRSNAPMVERIMLISKTMKQICMAHRIRGFSAIQVKREAENKSGESNASLKDLFGGDAWAQDADFVLLVNGKRSSSIRTLMLAKGRDTALGEFSVKFQLTPEPNFSALGSSVKLASAPQKVSVL